jgi:AhpD family alkylhydroperoxidase
MKSRMASPVLVLSAAMQSLQSLSLAIQKSGVPHSILHLVEMRASQINGCGVCLDMHARFAKQSGESDERLFALAGWRDAPYYTDAERAALTLTECTTRMADRSDPVPDDVWEEAARHFDERALSGLLLAIALINVWNRLNVTTRQVAGEWMKSAEAKKLVEENLAAR